MEDKRGTYGNEAMYEITPLEMNLSSEWKQQEVLWGELHSQFERVQNYLFTIGVEKRMLTIMCEGAALLPDSIILRYADYENLKKLGEFPAAKLEDYIQINYIKIAQLKTSNCSLLELSLDNYKEEYFEQKRRQIHDFIAGSERKSDFERLPERYKTNLNGFIEAMEGSDSERMLASFYKLIGAGRGLTPAADDAIIGVLAGYLLKLSLKKKADTYLKIVEPILSHLCREKLTTEVSLKYLKCACRGEFSQNLCKLIRILSGEFHEDIKPLLESIREIGHSSGMDMLYGLEMMLQRG